MPKQLLPVDALLFASATAAAQGPEPRNVPEVAVGTSQAAGPDQLDLFDLIRRLRHKTPPASAVVEPWDYRKPMLPIMPTFGAKPSTGVSVGAASSLAVYFGEPATTHISSSVVGASVSAKKQTIVTARFSANGPNDRVRVDGDNRFQWTSQDIHGLGTRAGADTATNAKFTYTRIYETTLVKLRPGLFGGVGLHFTAHANIRPGVDDDPAWESSPFAEYSREHGLPLTSQTSAGPSLNLMVDTRDHPINASRGWLRACRTARSSRTSSAAIRCGRKSCSTCARSRR